MLKGIDPLLTGPLLDALDRLGHGQELAIVDGNFPAYRSGAPVVRVAADLVPVVRAILSVVPLEPGVPLAHMRVDEDVQLIHPQMTAALALADEAQPVETIARADFYRRADAAALVILTSETEPYANLVLAKGVVLVTDPPAPPGSP